MVFHNYGGVHITQSKSSTLFLVFQEEDANQLHHQLHQIHPFNPRNGEFTCPLCRQLGNCVLPIVPSQIIPTNTAAKVRGDDKNELSLIYSENPGKRKVSPN